MIRTFLIASLLLAGCDDPYGDAKAADTIEAYNSFLGTNPSGTEKMLAEKRLEELMVEKAKESHAIPDYDAVLKRFPSTKKKKEMQDGRANAAFAIADAAGTAEAWKSFIQENPGADGALKKRAKQMLAVADYVPTTAISEPVASEVNLAGDPKGANDGWGFTADVTNNSEKALEYVNLELQFLDSAGAKMKAVTYPVAATIGPGGMPIEERLTKPLAPGEKRAWNYTTGDVPAGWADAKKLKLVLVAVTPVAAAPPK